MPPRSSVRARGKSPFAQINGEQQTSERAVSPPRRSTRYTNSGSRNASPQPPSLPASIHQSLDGRIQGRPALPLEHANELVQDSRSRKHPWVLHYSDERTEPSSVKEQTLSLEHEKIVIYRQKVPTPKGVSGHLIRRTDTDAVSASSLFRCAFPTASTVQEEEEMRWIANTFSTVAAGREDEPRGTGKLTGKWIPTADAIGLAEQYGVTKFAIDLFEYVSATPPQNETLSPHAPGLKSAEGTIDINSDVCLSYAENLADATKSQLESSPSSARASKRVRRQSPTPASPANHNVVTTTSTVVTAPDGSVTETTQVAIELPEDKVADNGATTEEQQIRLVEASKELVESLKENQILPNGASEELAPSRGKKRGHEEIEVDDPAVKKRGGWFGKKDRQIAGVSSNVVATASRPMTPRARRTAAFAGLAFVGLATWVHLVGKLQI